MTTITDIILTPELPLSTPVQGVDFDPQAGSGALLDEIDAPDGIGSAFFAYDPYVAV